MPQAPESTSLASGRLWLSGKMHPACSLHHAAGVAVPAAPKERRKSRRQGAQAEGERREGGRHWLLHLPGSGSA